jgi:hypothetical protein
MLPEGAEGRKPAFSLCSSPPGTWTYHHDWDRAQLTPTSSLLGPFAALEIFWQMFPVENISQGCPLLYEFLVEVPKV